MTREPTLCGDFHVSWMNDNNPGTVYTGCAKAHMCTCIAQDRYPFETEAGPVCGYALNPSYFEKLSCIAIEH